MKKKFHIGQKLNFRKLLQSSGIMAKRLSLTFFGACIISVALNAMIIPYGLLTGGVGGLAIIGNITLGLPVYLGILLLNIPLLIWGFFALPWRYMLQCLIGVIVISATLPLTQPFVPEPHLDIFVATIFSGALSGIGGGLILRAGASAGGTDIISVICKRKWNISVGSSSFAFNLLVMLVGCLLFDIRYIMYSIISMYIAGKTANTIVDGFNKNKSVMIISDQHADIAGAVLQRMGRGVTYLQGCGGYSGEEKNVIICVVSNYELATVREIVHELDPGAFFFVSETAEVSGKGFKEHAMHQ